LIRIILILAAFIFILFVIRLVKLLTNFKSGSTSGIDDLKDKAEHLKNKYKDLEEADFRDITLPDEESDSFKEDNA
jgi:uncharacterized membrane protein